MIITWIIWSWIIHYVIDWNDDLFQLFTLIMIDVKLTPSGFDRLPVCMNG